MAAHGNLVYCKHCLGRIDIEAEHVDEREWHYHPHCIDVARFRGGARA